MRSRPWRASRPLVRSRKWSAQPRPKPGAEPDAPANRSHWCDRRDKAAGTLRCGQANQSFCRESRYCAASLGLQSPASPGSAASKIKTGARSSPRAIAKSIGMVILPGILPRSPGGGKMILTNRPGAWTNRPLSTDGNANSRAACRSWSRATRHRSGCRWIHVRHSFRNSRRVRSSRPSGS